MKRTRIRTACLLLACIFITCSLGCAKGAAEKKPLPDREKATYAVLVGTTSEKIVDESFPHAVKLPFDSVNDAVLALLSGKADYVVSAYTNCMNFARANPGKLAILPDPLTNEGCAIAVNKSETALLSDVDRVIAQLRADGTLDTIVSNWMREDGADYVRAEIPVNESGAVLAVAVSAEREPMCFVENGEITGLDAELIQRIAYELGMRVEFSDMKFAAMIPSVLSGKTPVAISNISPTDERRESVSFSAEYYLNPQVLLTRAEFDTAAEDGEITLADLAGKRIGVSTGSIFDQIALEQWPDAKLLYYENTADQIIALQQDKIDAFLSDEPVARQVALSTPGIKMLDERLMDDKYGFAFQKNDKGATLRDEFNAFMQQAEGGKLLETLDTVWFGTDERVKIVMEPESLPAVNGVIRFAASMETPPFSYLKDGVPVGTEIDLITRFCKEKGYGLQIETVAFGALLPGLVTDRYDAVASSISITEERAESVHFSDPFYLGGAVAVVPDKGGASAQALVSPETARIGAHTGTSFEGIAMDRFPNAEYSSFSTLESCMLALKSGQIDYVVMADLDAKHYQTTDANYKMVDPPLQTITVCAAISKDKPELKRQIDTLLDQYEAEGLLDRLYANWFEAENFAYVREEVPVRTEGEALRVIITSASEPSAFLWNGELCGYDIELVQRLAYDMGMQVEFIDVAGAAMVPTLASGKGDVILCGLTYTEERAEKVLFSRPYITLSTVLAYYQAADGGGAEAGFFSTLASSFRKNFVVEQRWKLIVSGIGITLLLSVCAGVFGILVGFGFCLMRMSSSRVLNATAAGITRVLQGTPMVVLLMILYYIVFNKTGLDGVAVAIIAFGINFGAYASEIMLSGIRAVDDGQREAAAAIGFSPAQTFLKIVFPQAARHFLPVLKGEYISLVKMTSIVGYVAVQDLTKVSDIIRSRTYEAFFPLIVTALIYFLLSFALSSLLKIVEVRIDPKHRPRTLKGVEIQ